MMQINIYHAWKTLLQDSEALIKWQSTVDAAETTNLFNLINTYYVLMGEKTICMSLRQ